MTVRPPAFLPMDGWSVNGWSGVLSRPAPVAPASGPKVWTQRLPGECAYPVDGYGEFTRSCCLPVGERYDGRVSDYCPGHHALMFTPARAVLLAVKKEPPG